MGTRGWHSTASHCRAASACFPSAASRTGSSGTSWDILPRLRADSPDLGASRSSQEAADRRRARPPPGSGSDSPDSGAYAGCGYRPPRDRSCAASHHGCRSASGRARSRGDRRGSSAGRPAHPLCPDTHSCRHTSGRRPDPGSRRPGRR